MKKNILALAKIIFPYFDAIYPYVYARNLYWEEKYINLYYPVEVIDLSAAGT